MPADTNSVADSFQSQELVAVLVPGTINLDRFTTDKSTAPSS